MNSSTSEKKLVGAACLPVPAADCLAWLQWVMGTASAPPRSTSIQSLLAHCDDGVTWGKLDDKAWKLGSTAFPDLSPRISTENLIELRLFGKDEELLIWRDDSQPSALASGFRGRWLSNNPDDRRAGGEQPARPHDESRILIGNKFERYQNGFTHVSDGTGREQAVPIECQSSDFGTDKQRQMPLSLTVRHYFEILEPTGAVRVAASRLVGLSSRRR